MSVKVKICGINSREAAETAALGGADYLGFIFFARSPRNVTLEQALEYSALLPKNIQKVAVTVDESDPQFEKILKYFKADFLQLHGTETLDRVKEVKKKFGLPIIKACSIKRKEDVVKASIYREVVDFVMFDSKAPENSALPGGNGLAFDWQLLADNNFKFPWILSGGLNPKNVAGAIKQTGANFVDVSSGVESAPGRKDRRLIAKFLKNVKNIK